jgi:hypothetical protein
MASLLVPVAADKPAASYRSIGNARSSAGAAAPSHAAMWALISIRSPTAQHHAPAHLTGPRAVRGSFICPGFLPKSIGQLTALQQLELSSNPCIFKALRPTSSRTVRQSAPGKKDSGNNLQLADKGSCTNVLYLCCNPCTIKALRPTSSCTVRAAAPACFILVAFHLCCNPCIFEALRPTSSRTVRQSASDEKTAASACSLRTTAAAPTVFIFGAIHAPSKPYARRLHLQCGQQRQRGLKSAPGK